MSRAGDLIAAAIPKGDDGRPAPRTAAGVVVAGEFPEVNGATRRELVERWRRYFQRWLKANYLEPQNAAIVERYFGVPAENLTRPVLTENERRLREAQRLERKARELRKLL